MLLETSTASGAAEAAALSGTVLAQLAQGESARTAPRTRPGLTPIYIEHKKKVPCTTLELATRDLNPLQRRALERLPRLGGVPVIRAIGKGDNLGFTFTFRIDPSEVTGQALPALLERWDEKYEIAKARVTPKPPPAEQPLKPRSPMRKQEDQAQADGDAASPLATRGDLSLIDAAIAKYDSKTFAAIVTEGGGSQAQSTDDPLGSSMQPDWQLALDHQDQQEQQQEPQDLQGPATGASVAQAAISTPDTVAPRESAIDPLPPEYVLNVPSFGQAKQISQTPADAPAAKPRTRSKSARTPAATAKAAPPEPARTTDHDCASSSPATAGINPARDLPALRLAAGDMPDGARLWTDPEGGQVWNALALLELRVGEGPTVQAQLQRLPLDRACTSQEDRAAAAGVQLAAQAWLDESLPMINEQLAQAMKDARIQRAQRTQHVAQALAELPAALERLQELLLDMQLAADLGRRIERHLLAMPDWAMVVRETLNALPDWHGHYLLCANFLAANATIKRWCTPMSSLQLTGQDGLFAEPAAIALQRQLRHLVDHAHAWNATGGTRGDCLRVLAAWVDAAHHWAPSHENSL